MTTVCGELKNQAEMKKKAAEMWPTVAGGRGPVSVDEKTAMFPLGVLNMNEGLIQGLLKLVKLIQEKSTFSEEEWESKVHILDGDYLTSHNLWSAHREWMDDVTPAEQLEPWLESSQLFHFAINALYMIVWVHLGQATINPASLSAYKDLLFHTWDTNKPDYTHTKALVQHSLIAHILSGFMYVSYCSTIVLLLN